MVSRAGIERRADERGLTWQRNPYALQGDERKHRVIAVGLHQVCNQARSHSVTYADCIRWPISCGRVTTNARNQPPGAASAERPQPVRLDMPQGLSATAPAAYEGLGPAEGQGRANSPALITGLQRAPPATYVMTWQGWAYLATVIDLPSRRAVGWALADHLRTSLAGDALTMAFTQRRPAPGVILYSDRGCSTPVATTPPWPGQTA
ncbi:MAG: DDE-type integrase/transposase/recombinase [Solirubrobacteraceae bacterium]